MAAALLFAMAGAAEATQAVDSPAVSAGESTATLNGYRDGDSDDALDGAGEHVYEFGHAPTASWKTTVGWLWAAAPGARPESAGFAWENLFALTTPGSHWADLGALVSYSREFDGGDDALELALLAEKQAGPATVIVNLLAARALEDSAETAVGYALSVSLPLVGGLDAGIEWYGELGEWNALGRLGERVHQAGPVVYGEVAFAGGAFRYESAVLFGLTRLAPDRTMRLQVEYAF